MVTPKIVELMKHDGEVGAKSMEIGHLAGITEVERLRRSPFHPG
jgi:hypothetical protein